ncbi:restriction endonuclease [Arthrobacter zhaoxinii]|uniref:restriction endonuclease n=1 Tax=Arthrobacter zhaoxinii TaxID=2964616 RepID=UPI002102161D|nr:restriction endonuclease [Arthrobacter zhaoxinii]MCQ2002222.1 restriction endonuclease [Arthrobacter zhaoxinii]
MELDQLLTIFDKVTVNLNKLEQIWDRASPLLPEGPSRGSTPEYQNLVRAWEALLPGLAPIDGWRISESLPEMDALGQMFLDYAEIQEPPLGAYAVLEKPSEDLAEYRFRLDQARRRAIASRLEELTGQATRSIQAITATLPTMDDFIKAQGKRNKIETDDTRMVEHALAEIERLLGDTVERQGRWGDLRRHLRFSEVNDWHEINEFDWPSVRLDIEAARFGETDPIPVPEVDLGMAGRARPSGGAATALNWAALTADQFERLLFDILRSLDGYQNIDWLMNTNAADRGRDISLERIVQDAAGSTRTERVIVQAKHYTSKSVGPGDVQDSLSRLSMWQPPVIRFLIIATSGRFTADAVSIVEQHNGLGKQPQIEMWPDNRMEVLLAQQPTLAITYGLRS